MNKKIIYTAKYYDKLHEKVEVDGVLTRQELLEIYNNPFIKLQCAMAVTVSSDEYDEIQREKLEEIMRYTDHMKARGLLY